MRTLSFLVPVVIAGCTLALAACGSSAKLPTAATDVALKFSQCMRSHGVTSFPDPGSGGSLEITPGSGINPQSPAFQTAQQACKQYAPNKAGPPRMSESQRTAAVRFAECMRRNGQTNFTDPTLKAPAGITRLLVLRGMVFPIGAGIDPGSPGFRQAATKCGVTPPNGAPQTNVRS